MNYTEKMRWIRDRKGQSRAAERICSEIICLDGVSAAHGGEYDREIERAADFIIGYITENGAVTNAAVAEAEAMLAPLAGAVKSYTALFVSHAHIDMNWMWGYNETAAITVDTFRTVLDMMAEYPDFTFAQSQASTYEIIEKFRPDMLDEIKARIKEGRWEVTAAEWVEPDKNMPDGESLTRQILQSRKYLSRLLDISPDSLCIDFVPDTFGHNANVPEILADAGVKYMYHCRGTDGPRLYRFVAPSGKSTFNYREFRWYNGEISTESFEIVPAFCSQEKVDTLPLRIRCRRSRRRTVKTRYRKDNRILRVAAYADDTLRNLQGVFRQSIGSAGRFPGNKTRAELPVHRVLHDAVAH